MTGLIPSGTGCFIAIAVPIWQQWASKGYLGTPRPFFLYLVRRPPPWLTDHYWPWVSDHAVTTIDSWLADCQTFDEQQTTCLLTDAVTSWHHHSLTACMVCLVQEDSNYRRLLAAPIVIASNDLLPMRHTTPAEGVLSYTSFEAIRRNWTIHAGRGNGWSAFTHSLSLCDHGRPPTWEIIRSISIVHKHHVVDIRNNRLMLLWSSLVRPSNTDV